MSAESIRWLTLLLVGQTATVLADNFTGITGSGAAVNNRQPTLVLRYMICVEGGIFPDNIATNPTQSMPPDRSFPVLGEIKAVPFDYNEPPRGWRWCEGQLLPISQNSALFSLLLTRYGGNGTTHFALPDLRGRVPIGAGLRPEDLQLGQTVGVAQMNLVAANLPPHTHGLPGGAQTGSTGSGAPTENRQPSLALDFLIAANGEIMIVPWPQNHSGWTRCDGRLISVAGHGYLFNHIGYRYGGSGANFALPDTRGRVLIGDDAGVWQVGQAHGDNSVALTVADMPAHTHTIPGGSTGSSGSGAFSTNNYQPSLVMRWVITPYGVFPIPGNSVGFPMVSEIRITAGPTADGVDFDDGWFNLYGELLQIDEYDTLYTVLGTTYGGDGQETFALPDLRNRVAIAKGSGLLVGETLGSNALLSSIPQLAAHTHALVEISIRNIQYFADGSVQLTLLGTVGATCQVDKSDEFGTWTNLGSVQFTTATRTITDPNPTGEEKRFYQAYFP